MHGRARPLELCLPSGQIAACGLGFFLVLDCMFVSCTCGCTHTTAPPTPRVNTDPPVTHSDNRWKRTQGGGMKVEMERPRTPSTSKKRNPYFSASTSASPLPCVRACVWWKKGKEAELCVLYLNGFVEKPARPLAAEGGGACRVWESRQRRHKHTDTGSLEPPEKRQTRVRIPGTTGGGCFAG